MIETMREEEIREERQPMYLFRKGVISKIEVALFLCNRKLLRNVPVIIIGMHRRKVLY